VTIFKISVERPRTRAALEVRVPFVFDRQQCPLTSSVPGPRAAPKVPLHGDPSGLSPRPRAASTSRAWGSKQMEWS
jgi:hypothetical protein